MRRISTILYGIILAYVVVGVTAPNPAIADQKNPGRASEMDDLNPQTQLRKLLQRYNLRAPVDNIESTLGIRFKDGGLEKMRRRLAQFVNESPATEPSSSLAPASGPAPGPQAETTPAPPPINPFVPPSNDSNLACCCRTGTTYYEEPYQQPTPPYCCCGSRNSCCPQGSLINVICGGGQVCGILMLLSALIAVLVLSICMTGTFYARRRRQQLLAMHGPGGPNGAIGGVGGGGALRPGSDQITIPEEDIPGLRVKFGSGTSTPITSTNITEGEESAGCTADNSTIADGTAETNECPICLDTVPLHSDTWAVFPCTHGCCRPCFTDLLRHSSRRVNNNIAWAVNCPLCRKIAVAPEGEQPTSGQPSSPTAAAVAAAAGETLVPIVIVPVVPVVVENSSGQPGVGIPSPQPPRQ